jgi:cytochrome c oxidase assembly protein subunit 15
VRAPRISPRAYQWICLVTVAAVAIIIVTGAAVRLTGSGLGCDDWPRCTENSFVGVSNYNQQIEQVNRLFTGVVSISVILAVLGSLWRDPRRRDLVRWSLGLVAGILAQIVLGGITVLSHLWPPFVMGHFVLSAILVWNAVVLHHRAGHPDTPGVATVDRRAVVVSRLMVVAAAAVLVTGTVVTGTGPHGGDEKVARLPFEIEEVARIHSLTAWAFLGLAVAAIWLLHRSGPSRAASRRSALLTAAILVQGAIGYTQYFNGVPPELVILHVAGSVVVWIAALSFHLNLFAHPDPVGVGAPLDLETSERDPSGPLPSDGPSPSDHVPAPSS